MSEIELKACPFCGREPKISDLPESAIHVSCRCGASLFGERHHHADHAEATARWNTRAPQWQPIESAPKTTRSILVWCPERQNQYMVSWDDRYGGEWRTVGGGTVLTESPTHWQPLPAPPEVEG
ncbi:Lar family restriction alleviation protein [Stenotrophomonas cyclobalanopsidis]|uniref:Lar family restriction alleviation protein n=1 Tax=Stenotrophomonas cyclobalanopsidis TaxID=2771362 RepID=UPI002FDA9408